MTSLIVSAIIYLIFNITLEAYVGVLLSIFIIKAGIELIKESVDNMLGVRIESELAKNIKKDVIKEKDVRGAFDLVLNNYGPDKYLGSIHIEVFPCNQFGSQAPGSDDEIHQFCQLKYNTSFDQFLKIDVNGGNEEPLYTYKIYFM